MSRATPGKVVDMRRKMENVSHETDVLSRLCNKLRGKEKVKCFMIKDDIAKDSLDARTIADNLYYDVTKQKIEIKKTVGDWLRELW